MPLDSLSGLVDVLAATQLLSPSQIKELGNLQLQFPQPRALAKELIRRGWLTPYQVNQVAQERAAELVVGPYVLLERVGEGGMGQVFKARHQLMNRLVAVKVIRTERLANPLAISRFQREIQAAAMLSHPHAVIAHDAFQVGNAYYLVMEYVEGTDLNKLVSQHGPLAVAKACDYIRQAALGLEHAHERGLVHRDVKPSNLLVSTPPSQGGEEGGVVKVLDLGLARLRSCLEEELAGSKLTQPGSAMGTPDYMAPEQALDSATVDIRADIYSLGCTFYYLLTGRPPFPGGGFAEKVLKHQQADPEPIERLRPDVPPALAAVIRTMMAKQPQERYPTPAAVVAALEAFGRNGSSPPGPLSTSRLPSGTGAAEPSRSASGTYPAQATTIDKYPSSSTLDLPSLPTGATIRPAGKPRRAWLVSLCVGGAFLLCLLTFGVYHLVTKDSRPDRKTGQDKGDKSSDKDLAARDRKEDKSDKGAPKDFVARDGKEDKEKEEDKPKPEDKLPIGPARLLQELKGHTGSVQCLAFAPGGKKLASGSDDQRVRLWRVPSGKEIEPALKHIDKVKALAWSRDGKRLAAASVGGGLGGNLKLWEVPTGREKTLTWKDKQGIHIGGGVQALAFSPDGHTLAAGGGPVHLWDLKAGGEPVVFTWQKEFPSYVYGVAFSPDGKIVVAGCHERGDSIRRWHVATREEDSVLIGNDSRLSLGHDDYRAVVAFSPNGKLLVRADREGSPFQPAGTLMVWDVTQGSKRITVRETFDLPGGRVYAVSFRPGGRLVVAVAKGKARLSFPNREETGVEEVQLWDGMTKQVQTLKTGHRKAVVALAFSADGKMLATGSEDTSIRLWDLTATPKKARMDSAR